MPRYVSRLVIQPKMKFVNQNRSHVKTFIKTEIF